MIEWIAKIPPIKFSSTQVSLNTDLPPYLSCVMNVSLCRSQYSQTSCDRMLLDLSCSGASPMDIAELDSK